MENIRVTRNYPVKLSHDHELVRADPAVILTTVNLRRISSINRLAKEFYGRELEIPRGKIKNGVWTHVDENSDPFMATNSSDLFAPGFQFTTIG